MLASQVRLGDRPAEDDRHDAAGNMAREGIVVIGGGLAGVATAHALAMAGATVLLLDKGDSLASGASHSNAGIMTSSMSDPWNGPAALGQILASLLRRPSALKVSPLRALVSARWGLQFLMHSSRSRHHYATQQNYRLADYSVHQTEQLARTLNLSYDQASAGSLKVFHRASALRHGLEIASVLSEQGLMHRALSESELYDLEPSLANSYEPIAGAIHFPGDRVGDARLFSQALGSDLARLGSVARLATRVTRIVHAAGRIEGIQTDKGIIRTGTIVIAAGAASAGLVRPVGIRLPIHPIKGYSITFDGAAARLPAFPIIDDAHHIAVTTFGNRLRVSGIAEISGHSASLDPRRIGELSDALRSLLPDISQNLDFVGARKWSGLRPVTPDGLPCIGTTEVTGLFVNTGHAHLGWTMAVGSARILADIMLGIVPEVSAQPFDPKRFS